MDLDAVWGGEWGRSRDGCIRWDGDRQREAAVLGVNAGHPIVTNGIRCVKGGDAALTKLLWDCLFNCSDAFGKADGALGKEKR